MNIWINVEKKRNYSFNVQLLIVAKMKSNQCVTGNEAETLCMCVCGVLLVLVVLVWEGGGICTVNLWPVRDTGAPTLDETDGTEGVPEGAGKKLFRHYSCIFDAPDVCDLHLTNKSYENGGAKDRQKPVDWKETEKAGETRMKRLTECGRARSTGHGTDAETRHCNPAGGRRHLEKIIMKKQRFENRAAGSILSFCFLWMGPMTI